MRGTLLALAVVMLASSCAGGGDVSGDRRVVGGVTVTFSVRPARVEVGRTVRLALRVTNIAGRPEKLTFPSAQQYDFWVTRGEEEVWRWSDDRVFTQSVEKRTIDPQGTITLSESWVANESGEYRVHGQVLAEGYGRDLTGSLRVGG
jgi:hypothetical protein